MRPLLFLGALACTACPQSIDVFEPDVSGMSGMDGAVSDRGRPDDAATDLGTDAGTGADLGPSDLGADGGLPDAGPRQWTVGEVGLPSEINRSLRAVRVIAPGRVLVGNSSGSVIHLSTAEPMPTRVWRTTDNTAIRAIEVAGTQAIVAGERGIFEFGLADLTTPQPFFNTTGSVVDFSVAATRGFAVTEVTNTSRLYGYEVGVGLTQIVDLPPNRLTVFAVSDTEAYIGGYGSIQKYEGVLTDSPVTWPADFDANDISNFQVTEIGRIGQDIYATGSEQSVLLLDEGAWVFVSRGAVGYEFNTLAEGPFFGGEDPGNDVLYIGPLPYTPIGLPRRSVVRAIDGDPSTGFTWVAGYERNGIEGRLFRLEPR